MGVNTAEHTMHTQLATYALDFDSSKTAHDALTAGSMKPVCKTWRMQADWAVADSFGAVALQVDADGRIVCTLCAVRDKRQCSPGS